ncbi:hypothetical protein C8T65DRAFT_699564 [Cerioporus squamosus]|nr:hypothetical protein C8T65DRAFT_699564 [Cerioporus squamosus]
MATTAPRGATLPIVSTPGPVDHLPAPTITPTREHAHGQAHEGRRSEEGGRKEPVRVYARWAGYVKHPLRTTLWPGDTAHVYSTAIPPEEPLEIGMRIRILATTPAWYSSPGEDPDTYDAYDAHIVGAIVRIVGWKGRKVVLEVVNECRMNAVRTARIRIPFAPEVTVHSDLAAEVERRAEAQEKDLNTAAVVRASTADASCQADTCWMPWRSLVGEDFLWEPMFEDVGERRGATGGRRKVPRRLVGWAETAGAMTRKGV